MFNAGKVKPGSTVYIPVNTFDSNDPSGSVTATTWANTDCHIHKDGGTTQRASSSGETLSIDFDTIAGNHLLSIDTSDNTTANFYEAGSTYHVRIEGVTVDGGNINAWIGTFYIGYDTAIIDTTIATLSTQVSFTLEDGSTDDDAYNDCVAIVHDLASAVQVAIGRVSDYTGSTKTITLEADPGVFTMAAGDSISILPTSVGALRPTTSGRTLDVAATGEAGLDFGNATGSITGGELGVGAFASGAITAAAIAADAIGASELASDAVTEIRDAITGGAYALDTDANGRARIVDGTGAGELNTASGSVDVVTIEGVDATDQINAACDASIETYHLDHLLAADYDPASKPGIATALLNELVESDAGVSRFTSNALEAITDDDTQIDASALNALTAVSNISSLVISAGGAVDSLVQGFLNNTIAETTADNIANNFETFYDNGNATTASIIDDVENVAASLAAGVDVLTIEGSDATDQINAACDAAIETYGLDHLVGAAVVGTDVADNSIFAKLVSASATADWDNFVNTTDSLQALRDHVGDGTNLTEAGGTGDHLTALDVASISTGAITAASIATDAIGAAELATDAVNEIRNAITGGAYALDTDANGRARIVDGTGAGEIDTASGRVQLTAATETQIDNIETDTNELQTDDVPGLIAALNDVAVADILTTQMTEAYAANGTAPTLAQALFAIHQKLMQFAYDGTTSNVYKLDNTTVAFSGTLDDGTSPTEDRRA